jgi:PBSX family phage terminase large subunit
MPNKQVYEPSAKARDVYKNAHLTKYRLLEGAIRSSKTYTANIIAIKEISELPACNIMISGYSITSAARNVLSSWKELIAPNNPDLIQNVREGKDEHIRINWRGLRNKKFYVRGAGKENDFKQIQGATFGYWLADEFTRHNEAFINMAMTRLSPPYAKMIGTTNADSPFHYVKTRFIDNKNLFTKDSSGKRLWSRWSFVLGDNPSLTTEYKRSLTQLYKGVFYKRYVLGLWIIAEGSIYDFFDYEANTLPRESLPPAQKYFIGIDYGTGAPTCFILFGYNSLSIPRIWAEKEYYWDSKAEGRQKTDAQYAEDLRKFIGNKEIETIYCDPSSASFIAQCILPRDQGGAGISNIIQANNDILDGIRTHARLLSTREYMLCRDCKRTIQDYDGYCWDEKLQLKGIDAPLPGPAEHSKDAERYFLHTEFASGQLTTGGRFIY